MHQNTTTQLTALEAATITLYNGASVTIWIKNNKIVRPKTKGATAYISSWKFDPDADEGERWTYIPNRNNYLFKAIHDEYEGGLPIEE